MSEEEWHDVAYVIKLTKLINIPDISTTDRIETLLQVSLISLSDINIQADSHNDRIIP